MPVPSRSQLAVYALVVGLVVVLGGRVLRASSGADPGGRGVPAAGAAAPTGASGAGAGPASPASGGVVVQRAGGGPALVHVAGAVRRPGVYRLAEGDRVRDAVARAGGRAPGADVDAINLAAKVVDGQRILVPRRGGTAVVGGAGGATASGGGATGAAGGAAAAEVGAEAAPVDLNAATLEQLDTLDGVGPAIAAKILAWREEHGGFRSVDDLGQIPGIGPKRLEALRSRVMV
ncbi:MAG: competence protein ComEA [Solirubrobacteraceae bacterium]|nr:competence protein ComEA [Solirubrobacteraceae bacterium]